MATPFLPSSVQFPAAPGGRWYTIQKGFDDPEEGYEKVIGLFRGLDTIVTDG